MNNYHADLVVALMGNMTEAQMPDKEDEFTSIWSGETEQSLFSCMKKIPLQIKQNWETYDKKDNATQYEGGPEKINNTQYEPDHVNFDVLHKLYFDGMLPHIKVKEEYSGQIQIAWTPYAIFKMIKSLEWIVSKEKTVTTLIPEILFIFSQYDVDPTFRAEYEINIGNIPELLDFKESLPLTRVTFPIPFSFTRAPEVSIPLFLHQEKKVSFIGKFRTHVDEMILMQERVNGVWEDIPFDAKYLQKYENMSVPKLVGKYAKLIGDEKHRLTHKILSGDDHFVCSEDFICNNENFTGIGEVSLQDTTPTKNIFWFAQRTEVSQLNQFTNLLDKNASSPQKYALITISKEKKEPFVVVDPFEDRVLLMEHCVGRPTMAGLHFYTFGTGNLFSLNSPLLTAQLKGLDVKLKVVVEEKDKRRRVNGGEKEEEELYNLFFALHVVKKIRYYKEDEDNLSSSGRSLSSFGSRRKGEENEGRVSIEMKDVSGQFMRDIAKNMNV